MKVNNIFVFIYPDYDRLIHSVEHDNFWFMDNRSFHRNLQVKARQTEIIQQIKIDWSSALIVYPYIFHKELFRDTLSVGDNSIIDEQREDLRRWQIAIDDRMVVLDDLALMEREKKRHRFEKLLETGNETEETVKYPSLKDLITFPYTPNTTDIYAFGSYSDALVNQYGRGICHALKISDHRFHILQDASIKENELVHITEEQFNQEAHGRWPGWTK